MVLSSTFPSFWTLQLTWEFVVLPTTVNTACDAINPGCSATDLRIHSISILRNLSKPRLVGDDVLSARKQRYCQPESWSSSTQQHVGAEVSLLFLASFDSSIGMGLM